MANRSNTFLLKRSNVLNKIPVLSGLTLGELALNTADAKLYTLYTEGLTGATEVREIGWNRLSISGGTIYGSLKVNDTLTANTIHTTYIYDKNNNLGLPGQVLSTTVNGVEWVNVTGTTNGGSTTCTVDTASTYGLEYKKITTISGLTQGSYIIKSYLSSFSGTSKYGFWERTLGVVTTGGTPVIIETTEDFDVYSSNFLPSQVVYTPISNNSIEIYVSGLTSENLNWTSYYNIVGQNCGSSGTVAGFTDFYVTGGTFSGTTLTLNRQNGSITITGFTSGGGSGVDTYVTGFTYSNNNLTISQNQGQSPITVNISTMTGLTVAGNITVTGSTSLRNFTATAGVISGTGQSILTIVGSGSSTSLPLFTVQGSSGELFSVSDSLQGSLFSVNDISGLPILEVFSDNTTLMGSYLAPSLNTTVRSTLTAGTNTIYSIPTSAYTGAFFDYALIGSAGARAGNIMSIFSGTTVQFTEVTTNDIGNTTPVSFSMSVSSGLARLSSSATTTGWTLKTIVRSI